MSSREKEQAVIDLRARNGSAAEVAQRHGVSRVALYKWKNSCPARNRVLPCLRNIPSQNPQTPKTPTLPLKIAVRKINAGETGCRLEKSSMSTPVRTWCNRKGSWNIKKDKGTNLNTHRNCEKAKIIDALRKNIGRKSSFKPCTCPKAVTATKQIVSAARISMLSYVQKSMSFSTWWMVAIVTAVSMQV